MKKYILVEPVECIRALAVDTNLDETTLNYLITRFESEGIKFLTVVLPKFVQWVEFSIDIGILHRPNKNWSNDDPRKFTHFAWKNSFPLVFRGLLSQIFDTDGRLRPYPSAAALSSLRQWGYLFYKLALPFTDEQQEEAERKYVSHEEKLAKTHVDERFVDSLRKRIEYTYRFPSLYDILGSHRPRFGPGTYSCHGADTSSGATRQAYYKYKLAQDATSSFTKGDKALSGYFKPYPGCPTGLLRGIEDTSDLSEVLFVPKDSRGPRVISREPLKRLQLQMSFHDAMVPFIERVTKNRVNFRDQQINRDLARQGSLDGKLSTIDLKDASDSVQGRVVDKLFRYIPSVSFFLKRRSREAVLPSGQQIKLRKMSGMGSGLTFPVMAFICHTAISHYIAEQTALSYEYVTRFVYVYGDDIIVPTDWVDFAYIALGKVGLTVNVKKSFSGAHPVSGVCFRESCGGDFFGGISVTPVRMKFSNSKPRYTQGLIVLQSVDNALVELDALSANLADAHYCELANYFYGVSEEFLGYSLPTRGKASPWLGRYSPNFRPLCDKTGTILKALRLVPVPRSEVVPDAFIYAIIGDALKPSNEIDGVKGIYESRRPTRWREVEQDQSSGNSDLSYEYIINPPREFKIQRRRVLIDG